MIKKIEELREKEETKKNCVTKLDKEEFDSLSEDSQK